MGAQMLEGDVRILTEEDVEQAFVLETEGNLN